MIKLVRVTADGRERVVRVLFPGDVVQIEFILVFLGDFSAVRHKYIPVLGNAQNCGTCATFACSQYDQSLSQRSLMRASVAKTRIMVINQKRMVILLSGKFFFWKWWCRGDIKKMRLPSPKRFLVYLK